MFLLTWTQLMPKMIKVVTVEAEKYFYMFDCTQSSQYFLLS